MTYAVLSFPFRAAVGPGGAPARFLAGMAEQQLRYGHPARRTGGLAWAALARRRRLPTSALARLLAAAPKRPRPDLDELLDAVRAAWPRLTSPLLPVTAPEPLTTLAVRRSVGETVFVFGDAPHPLVVLKPGDVARETAALRAAAPSGVVPRPLGEVGGLAAQEGRPGAPSPLVPVYDDTAASLAWPPAFDLLSCGLARLAATTVSAGRPAEADAPLARAAAETSLGPRAPVWLDAAVRDLAKVEVAVLRHGDLSGQNWLVDGDRLGGIVDWETAEPRGVPGFDAWHAGVSWFEQGVGLGHWSDADVVACFERAWVRSEFFARLRAAARETAAAAGVPDRLHDSLEVAFFARRLGRRLLAPDAYALSPAAAAAMLRATIAG